MISSESDTDIDTDTDTDFVSFSSCSFYVAFWSLSLYDLHIPKERYNDEINKAKDVIQSLENNQEMVN